MTRADAATIGALIVSLAFLTSVTSSAVQQARDARPVAAPSPAGGGGNRPTGGPAGGPADGSAGNTSPVAPAQAATVAGTVFVADTTPRMPARRVRVTLNEVDRRVPGQTTATDDTGAFVFTNVPAGRFELDAYRSGFLRASFGASRPNRPGTPIVVRPGDRLRDLTVSIAHGGVITGVVRDRQGRPVPDVDVRVLRLGYSATSGEPALTVPSGSTINPTDDRGEYRAFDLPPGGYIVLAAPGPSSGTRGFGERMRPITSTDVQRALQAARVGGPAPPTPAAIGAAAALVSYTPIFHPDVTDVGRATTVTIGVGEERTGVDIAIDFVPTSVVSGRITSPTGVMPDFLQVLLAPNGPSPAMPAGLRVTTLSATPRADGTFSLSGVMPGAYTLKATTSSGAGRGRPPSEAPTMSGSAEIVVSGRDLDVPLTLTPGVPITGRVVFDGATPTPAELQTLTLQLMTVGSGGAVASTGGGRVDGQGRFSFSGIPADLYRVVWSWTASGVSSRWWVKSATVAGRDVFEVPLRLVDGRPVDLTVTFTDKPTAISGVFQDRGGRAATDYFVLVFPADRALWVPGSRRIQTTRPATDGAFDIRGLPPGDYLLGALTDLEPGEWNDPTLLAELAKVAIKVTLRDAQTTTQDIRIGG